MNAFDFSDKPVETDFEARVYKTTWERDYNKEKKDFVKTLSGRTKSDGKGIVTFNIGNGDSKVHITLKLKQEIQERMKLRRQHIFMFRKETCGGITISQAEFR